MTWSYPLSQKNKLFFAGLCYILLITITLWSRVFIKFYALVRFFFIFAGFLFYVLCGFYFRWLKVDKHFYVYHKAKREVESLWWTHLHVLIFNPFALALTVLFKFDLKFLKKKHVDDSFLVLIGEYLISICIIITTTIARPWWVVGRIHLDAWVRFYLKGIDDPYIFFIEEMEANFPSTPKTVAGYPIMSFTVSLGKFHFIPHG